MSRPSGRLIVFSVGCAGRKLVHARQGTRNRAFVGRGHEFAALASAFEAAGDGHGTLCLVSGEPGIGKSRLLTEFTAEQARNGTSIHWGFAWEAGGAPGYWPWIQVLRSVLAHEP
jgi:predicted ATPase